MRRGLTLALAAGLLAAAAVSVGFAAKRVVRQRAVAATCDAVRAERYAEALERSEGVTGPDADGRIAAECRCWALLASERKAACTALLEDVLAEPEAEGWVPDGALAKLLVRERREAGRLREAAALATRAARAEPEDLALLRLELETRSALEGEEATLRALESRLPLLEDPLPPRLMLAWAYERRGDARGALRVLGDALPPEGDPRLPAWVQIRTRALAALGRREEVVATYEAWRRAGGDPAEIRARYALRMSYSQLVDPEHSWTELLRGALAEADGLGRTLHGALYERLIGHLLVQGKREEALALYDRAHERFPLEAITREEIRRSAESGPPEGAGGGDAAGQDAAGARLRLALPAGAGPGTLLVSPPHEAPSDAPYREHAVAAGGAVTVERAPSVFPQRWVYRDAEGRTRASGTVWPAAGRTREVAVRPGPALEPPQRALPGRAPADGRRRVFTLILDCADWRIAQYLRARGELPVLDALLQRGHRAVLASRPPLTAAAMESLVWPTRGRHVTFLGLVHRLGLELAGLAEVGRNPLAFLSGVLPEGENLFETVGSGDRVAANMLFSHGLIDAGRHAELVGPRGRRRPARSIRAFRPLTEAERATAGISDALLEHPHNGPQLETMAAEFDAAVEMAREGEVDLLMLRVEPLDILTHGLYSEVARAGQDDGERGLYAAYRYVDSRLDDVHGALDADDVLVVMSDHGIRTAMEHSVDALFVAVGGDVPRSRAEGMPDLRGVSGVIAGLFGIETPWPATGVASWARSGEAVARRSTGSGKAAGAPGR